MEKDLLYRKVLINPQRGGGNVHKQLVIHFKYREGIMEKGHKDTLVANLGIKHKAGNSSEFLLARNGEANKIILSKRQCMSKAGYGQ